jgi:hypothetical protein
MFFALELKLSSDMSMRTYSVSEIAENAMLAAVLSVKFVISRVKKLPPKFFEPQKLQSI